MSFHGVPFPLARGPFALVPDSEVRWARATPTTCVMFVHGFNGRAVATWGEFVDIAINDARYSRCDLVFAGYSSRNRTADFSAGVLYSLVEAFALDPKGVADRTGGASTRKAFHYDRIILVGHSLGGALVREVAMVGKRLRKPWAEKVRLVLFAPAHQGANIIELVQMGFGFLSWFKPAKAALVSMFPVLRDLEPGSAFLKKLLKTAQDIGAHPTANAKLVVHASDDRVVLHDRFHEDPPLKPYPNSNHSRCCKPSRPSFEDPVNDVAAALL